MRNTIQYYYGIEVDELTYENHKYYFNDYILVPIYKELNLDIYTYLSRLGLNNYEVIMNKDNKYQTTLDDKNYVLLKKKKNMIALNFGNLERTTIFIKSKQIIPWDTLWEQKVDYYERHVKTLSSDKIRDSFHYFIGLTENAISLYKYVKREENVFLAHIRLFNDDDYLNPINYTVDYRVRDVAEYTKKLVFENKLIFNDLMLYLYNNQFTSYEYLLFFIRLLYPSYYFDAYDLIAQGEEDSVLDKYLSQIDNYELFLKNIYLAFRQFVDIPRIEWLVNKKELSSDNSIFHPYL